MIKRIVSENKNVKVRLVILSILFSIALHARQADQIFAFWEGGEFNKTRMVVVGETAGIEKASVFESNQNYDLNVDTRPDTVTVKVTNPEGLRVGQILYLVETDFDYKGNNQGTIVGQFVVKSIFNTAFFGLNLRGEGYFRLIEDRIMTVAKPVESGKIQEAFLIRKKGDFFRAKGDTAQAIQSYKKAIHFDTESPDNHYALAKLHTEELGEGYISAGFEFDQSWKHREKFSDSYEKLQFYDDYIKFQLYRYKLEKNFKVTKLLSKALDASKESRMLYPAHYPILLKTAEIDYLLARTLDSSSTPNRLKKDELLEDAENRLKQAEKLETGDFHFYEIKLKVLYAKLNTVSSPESEVYTEIKTQLNDIGKKVLKFKPAKTEMDDETKAILIQAGIVK